MPTPANAHDNHFADLSQVSDDELTDLVRQHCDDPSPEEVEQILANMRDTPDVLDTATESEASKDAPEVGAGYELLHPVSFQRIGDIHPNESQAFIAAGRLALELDAQPIIRKIVAR